MNVPIKKIYAYSISMITLIMLITALWSFASAVVDFIYPVDYSSRIAVEENLEPPINEELTKTDYVKRESLKNIFKSLLRIAIILPFYIFHWKLARNA
ncbi:hypothetical protein AT15_06065 [Kosmotoga arenicorallina S304]|uniref:DUF5671 domain-containing protein n=1 Tax=Kosmotoga arenicorallina S304 TaxID=1453497 RepID=A0A176K3P1_9BACT|nr:hypothetical protein [Kosmotoga arenicorallina]OAA31636.1 hypothetical protein AT15_06065 [Kosmotoga arenicorallina S304]